MKLSELHRLVKQYERSINVYHDNKEYNEQQCRDEFINPLLECFGWDVQNKSGVQPQYKEVIVEKYSNVLERPDYTLTLNGVPKIFVEAKKPSVDITREVEPALQARKYGWNAKHKIVILTNFENMVIYDSTVKPKKGDNVLTAIYRKYNYKEYVDKYDEIYNLIAKETVYSGKYDEFVNKNFQNVNRYSTEIDDTFLQHINKWRLEIGQYLYNKDEKYKDIDVLNDVVQEFINQIIFLRICEDRNLPLYRKLKDTAKDKNDLQNSLTKVFKEADKKYNSGLFKGKNIIFDLNVDIMFNIITSLYYPQTPYLFNIIEPSILGKIYEAFLTESIILKDNKIVLAPKEEYKYRSVVATPNEIVKYMVKNTLEPMCIEKNPEEIMSLTIADIACGSGIFLEEAYQYLVDCCVEWYLKNNPSHLIELSNGKKKLPLLEKKKILTQCIFGIDIDIHAVEVTKFSLLLKLIEDETEPSVKMVIPVLPDLSQNICSGNSLISRDDIKSDINFKELREIAPFEWKDINNGRNFDAILGNPPYVNIEDMHKLLIKQEFDLYKKKYKSAYKQFDKYYLFVEKAIQQLKENGRLCYIIPNKFFKINSGQELRKIICNKTVQVNDFGDIQLFKDKTIYSAIVTIINGTNDYLKYLKVSSVASLWAGEEQESILIESKKIDKNPWRLSTDIPFLKMINNMEKNSVELSQVSDIFNGIQTSAERPEPIYWFDSSNIIDKDEYTIKIKKFNKIYSIEKSILKPYFKPTKADEKGMNTYTLLQTDKKIIFPYDNLGKLIDISIMKKNYPGTFKYLLDCYNYLVPKCLNNGIGRDIPNATAQTWYQYGRSQALTAFVNNPKLIVRVLSKVPMYSYDNKDMLISSGGTAGYCAISKKDTSEYDLEYIQAWLAHPYTEKLFRIMGSDFENGFTARGTFLLKQVPFAKIDFNNDIQRNLYNDVVMKTREIYKINDELINKKDKATIKILEKEKNRLIKIIEDKITLVYQQKF